MKNQILKSMTAMLLILAFSFSSVTSVYATDIDKQKQETQKAIDEANQKKKEAESDVSDLQKEANQLKKDYNTLYNKMSSINAQIAEANETIASTEEEISQLEAELEEAKKNEDAQYEAMKKRMVYFYENQYETNVLVAMITSGSFSAFIQKAAMISEIVTYDRNLLTSYQTLQTTIAQKSEALNAKYTDLQTAKSSLDSSQSEMKSLLNEAGADLSAKNGELATAKMSVEEYNKMISEMDAKMKSLEAQAAQAQADKAKELASQLTTYEDTTGAYAADEYETLLLAATIWAEARGESYTGQLAVASVIMNRVKSSKFPNTISGVIMAPKQFASYPDAVNKGMAVGADESCMKAAKAAIAGQRNGNWLFFMTKYYADKFGITGYTMIGNHAFFRVWGANVDTGVQETTEPTTPTTPTEPTTPTTPDPEPTTPTTPDPEPDTNTDNGNSSGSSTDNESNSNADTSSGSSGTGG